MIELKVLNGDLTYIILNILSTPIGSIDPTINQKFLKNILGVCMLNFL